ncbi:MAG: adenylate kinase [Rikenellaceae bacterium]|jgi:adenylate kinase|nr:adenylate kinase [Rikenellaceae bacterium]
MVNIVLFGPPGSGKGTQAAKLVEKYGLDHISTGDIIRREIREGSALGREVQDFIEKGLLAPDELVNQIIKKYIATHDQGKGNIFDGFPRTIPQAEAFDEMLKTKDLEVTLMVFLDVPDDELVDRILIRGRESGRADDSDIEVIKNRIRVYKEQTAVVADFYDGQGKYFPVYGQGTVDEVFHRITSVIEKRLSAKERKIFSLPNLLINSAML